MSLKIIDEAAEIQRLAEAVLENIQKEHDDYKKKYGQEYREEHPRDSYGLVRDMVDKELAAKETHFQASAISLIVTKEVAARIETGSAYKLVWQIVKAKRAPNIYRNKWVEIKRKSYAEMKADQAKLQKAATRRLERDLGIIKPEKKPLISPPPKPMQLCFGDILDDLDRGQ